MVVDQSRAFERTDDGRKHRRRIAVLRKLCAEFDIMYGLGISKEGSLLDLGVEEGVVAKSGAWYTYGEERLGQGREAAKEFLREHSEIRDTIEHAIREKIGLTEPGTMGAITPNEKG